MISEQWIIVSVSDLLTSILFLSKIRQKLFLTVIKWRIHKKCKQNGPLKYFDCWTNDTHQRDSNKIYFILSYIRICFKILYIL